MHPPYYGSTPQRLANVEQAGLFRVARSTRHSVVDVAVAVVVVVVVVQVGGGHHHHFLPVLGRVWNNLQQQQKINSLCFGGFCGNRNIKVLTS
jgi:hypothetical protein